MFPSLYVEVPQWIVKPSEVGASQFSQMVAAALCILLFPPCQLLTFSIMRGKKLSDSFTVVAERKEREFREQVGAVQNAVEEPE